MLRIAFDIDDTLFKLVEDTEPRHPGLGANCPCGVNLKQIPDGQMIALAHQLVLDPDNEVFLWSAGGVDHCQKFIDRFAPAWNSLVKILQKGEGQNIDICFDDQDVNLATTNLRIRREHSNHWQEFGPGGTQAK